MKLIKSYFQKSYLNSNKILNAMLNTNSGINFNLISKSKRTFAGCGDSSCGCESKMNHKVSNKELELKSINYEIIQLIEDGKYKEGLEVSDFYLKEVKDHFGENHKFLYSALNNKAFILKCMNRLPEAKTIYEEILTGYTKDNTVSQDNIFIVKQNLATALRDLKENHAAIKIYEELINSKSEVKPHIMINIFISASGSYRAIKQYDVAMNMLDKAEVLIEKTFGLDNDKSLPMSHLYNQKGLINRDNGDYKSALELLKKSLEIKQKVIEDNNHPEILMAVENISQIYIEMGEQDKAKEYLNSFDLSIKNAKSH